MTTHDSMGRQYVDCDACGGGGWRGHVKINIGKAWDIRFGRLDTITTTHWMCEQCKGKGYTIVEPEKQDERNSA